MTMPADLETDAARLRETMAKALTEGGVLADPGWRAAVERVPRHRFVPGFYLPADEPDGQGLTVWEPVTAELDHGRWLAAAYSDTTLITQFDGAEPDWKNPQVRHGGAPTSSSTLPSLVVRMWADADVKEGHTALEIGTGTGYSTALACELLGSADVTSIEVDPHRLQQAAGALYACGYTPTLAVADGLYGYWPEATFDRIVAACSFRAVPPALLAQTRPGGKILLTLSGWLYGYARVLLTVGENGTAVGRLLPGTVSFMSARTHAAPAFGNPAHWAAGLPETGRAARHSPQRITAATEEAFHLRFLAQCAAPDAQMTTVGDVVHLVDVVTGSAATLAPTGGRWEVREGGPVKLWERIERVLSAYDEAGRPGPETFTLHFCDGGQHLRHPRLPGLPLPRP
ncbi:ATP-grasp peptide maturase system methyltransferase [Streptomyces antibioticus]|uniref:Protein-L-isoaspartate O-methyltransferase n=1 Tax=Streptomyces antibioticus TaxID=1890 RepID=A0AAE6YGZ2_STRAT|nr:ATP-grasp peptide maturase system methyltransferase [Streptomyces antibioticus]MCX4740914.1 ATP-grasp peptide maturase system methyltransferase [Streptomyces antibioticus]MCX5173682.1 ATP-grasp peptide maturase system methyltransferase [Streptomyces antibioticus]OOQ48217.1 SAM-dependent methyltransferase [Streptomyces antibioticus]QIT48579.1 SAM-dependent methyltransferase [Streptomyces antibioticus]